ncbi:hypothetical protein GH714_028522 [Hevea brasiliensis]|uniref:Uncharacterized protein n=1 Tax=Hevea brasiliensis TaxID=3981 RepID=A0A6A6M155_HEVBR|nr:hypothetical protein GH714_028522 [Hevea brasiliensis]
MDRQLFIDARTGNVCRLLNLPEENDEERELRERLKWTPLHIPSLFEQVHFAREFLNRRPQFLQNENPDGCTALHLASSSGHFNMVEFLLSRGHDKVLCMKKDHDGRNPLHHAVIKGSVEVVRKLLEACPESALEVTGQRETVFHLAVKNRVSVSDELFSELLGGPYTEYLLNLADKKGNTVLHLASVRKQTRIISLLTEWRPSLEVNAVNSVGLTPLDLLVVDPINVTDMKREGIIKSKDGIREFLSRRPQFLQHENPDGCTALHLASSSGHFNMVEFLLSRGHDRVLCMKKDQDGRNPLHHAVIKGSAKVVRKLLEACPESALEVTGQRETVFHLAVKNRVSVSDELFSELLGGPYTEYLLNLADKKGNTVLHLASVRKQTRIISLLTEWRPRLEVNAVNSVGLRRPSLDVNAVNSTEPKRPNLEVNTVRSTVAPRPSLDVNAVNSSGLTPLDLLVVDPINVTDMKIEGIIKSKDGIRLNESQEQREHLKSIASGLW